MPDPALTKLTLYHKDGKGGKIPYIYEIDSEQVIHRHYIDQEKLQRQRRVAMLKHKVVAHQSKDQLSIQRATEEVDISKATQEEIRFVRPDAPNPFPEHEELRQEFLRKLQEAEDSNCPPCQLGSLTRLYLGKLQQARKLNASPKPNIRNITPPEAAGGGQQRVITESPQR